MPTLRAIMSLIGYCAPMLVCHLDAAPDKQTEALIEQLPQISQIGYGYSAMFSGSQFLPEPDSSEVHTLVIGSQAPTNSAALEGIVRQGALAVPSLLKHLDDSRETRIPPVSGMMWISFADEYDYNRRIIKESPAGTSKDTFGHDQPSNHIITVGDLCFVALGQIVNRNFNASRYQPSGGLVINSPTYSKHLCAVVRADFEGLTEEKHRDLLVQDFIFPDSEKRRNEACRRLAFYYPEILEPLVLKQLNVPTYDVFKINDFVRDRLYRTKSPEKRKAMFDNFIRSNGPACSDGILLQLFDDLDSQEANEQHRLSPPLDEKYDARALLIQLYGFTDAVSSTNRPYVATWNTAEEARFIRSLAHYESQKIDEAVSGILAKITDDDYLALACMDRLIGQQYDEQIRNYCKHRTPKSKYFASELRKMATRLDSRNIINAQRGGAANGNQPLRPETNATPAPIGSPR